MNTSIVGQKFNRWTVLRLSHIDNNHRKYVWCECECGSQRAVRLAELKYGQSKSCGCLQKETASRQQAKNNKARALDVYEASFNFLYRTYKQSAKRRGHTFDLSIEEFRSLTKSNCYYCGIEPSQSHKTQKFNGSYVFNGVDRFNNKLGYSQDNCVPCCGDCNLAKGKRTAKEFQSWIIRVYRYQNPMET